MKLNTVVSDIGRKIREISKWSSIHSRAHFVNVAKLAKTVPQRASFELIMPVGNADEFCLHQSVDAIANQIYANWRLRIVAWDQPHVELDPRSDQRISIHSAARDGWIATANKMILTSTCSFLSVITPDVILARDALLWAALYESQIPNSKWMYFDYLKSDSIRGSIEPVANPDFSAEYLLCRMFTGKFNIYKRELLQHVGGVDSSSRPAEFYDLALRVCEQTKAENVIHIPEFAYSELVFDRDGESHDRAVIEAAYRRRGFHVAVEQVRSHFQIHLPKFRDVAEDEVAIVIPTKNQLERLEKCVTDLRRTSNYRNYRIVVIDNRSDDPRLRLFFEQQTKLGDFSVFAFDEPFNYARMHNELIRGLDCPFVLLLNNDVYDFSNGWIEQLVGTAKLSPKIACVGGLLRFPDGMTQHGGVSFGIGRPCRHAHLGVPADAMGYAGRLQSMQQLSALTAALMLIRRETYLELGGFDEDLFPISYNDTDFCLKLLGAGYRSIYNPSVTAVHEESVSRGKSSLEKQWRRKFEEKWRTAITHDRFYSQHFSHRKFDIDPLWKGTWKAGKKLSLCRKIKELFHDCPQVDDRTEDHARAA